VTLAAASESSRGSQSVTTLLGELYISVKYSVSNVLEMLKNVINLVGTLSAYKNLKGTLFMRLNP